MSSVDQEILNLKAEGKSLRAIATALGISHEAVRKRLKGLEGKDQVPTKGNEKVSTVSIARGSRASNEVEQTVNQVSTPKTPSLPLIVSVNPLVKRSDKLTEGGKGASLGVLSECSNLLEAIIEFLQSKGIEIYRMEVQSEAYQISHDGQVIRFYVQRKQKGDGWHDRTIL